MVLAIGRGANMGKKRSWFLRSAWDVEDGYRMIFSNKPQGVNLVDVTVKSKQMADEITGEIISMQWTTNELITYLNKINEPIPIREVQMICVNFFDTIHSIAPGMSYVLSWDSLSNTLL